MTNQEKHAHRWGFAKDSKHGWRVARHEEAAWVAEYRLECEGIRPELLAYIADIGRAVK